MLLSAAPDHPRQHFWTIFPSLDFPKPKSFPLGHPPTIPFFLAFFSLFTPNFQHGIRNHSPQEPFSWGLLSFESCLIQTLSKIPFLTMISGLLPIYVFNQRNFLLDYAFYLAMLIQRLCFLSCQQIKTPFMPVK